MKPTGLLDYGKLTAITLLAIGSMVSCRENDNEEKNTDYVGTWTRIETLIYDEVELQVKDIMVFSENSVINLGQAWDPDTEEWIDLLAMEADIDVSRNNIDVSVTQVAVSDVDQNGIPTGELLYFTDEDPAFDAVLAEVELEQYFVAKYSVEGNELTLSMDDNSDGDFEDEGETRVYLRE